MSQGNGLSATLKDLHDTYVYRVNSAVAEDREDVIDQLAADYTEEALRLITAPEGTQPASA